MKTHIKKLMSEYAEAKLNNTKPFEIRLNDCDYKVGDFIKYIVPDNKELNEKFKNRTYRIEYITKYAQKDGYIVFTDKLIEVKENET